MAHTPGPWRVGDTTTIWGAITDPSTYGMGYSIAECGRAKSWSHHKVGPTEDESEANARLIAAAPELLEAAGAYAAWMAHEDSSPDYGGLTRDTHPQGESIWRLWWEHGLRLCAMARDKNRAAIAKATGATP